MENFEEAAIAERDPDLVYLCRDLSKSDVAECQGELKAVQQAFRGADFKDAFELLRRFLRKHRLAANGPFDGDRSSFKTLRKSRGSQEVLAAAIGVSQSAISKFERGERLGLASLLLAADYLHKDPRTIIQAPEIAPTADVLRIDQVPSG